MFRVYNYLMPLPLADFFNETEKLRKVNEDYKEVGSV